jgi:4-amino-4-deoxy-L-arabinose transferase-like glycosyltransferase
VTTTLESGKGTQSKAAQARRAQAHSTTIAIVAVALLARLFVVWFVMSRLAPGWLYGRGIELGVLARSIVAGRGLSSPFGGSTGPTALLAPGYPVMIAVIFRVFGAFTKASAVAIMAMQLGFSVLTVLVIMAIAQRSFGRAAAQIAGAFWAVSLPLIWMPTIFWETCFSTLLLTAIVALALRYELEPGHLQWVALGALCGLTALVNPALLLPLVGVLGWAGWQTRLRRKHPLWTGWLVLLLVFAPWPLRNALVLHAFVPLRSTIGLELWMGNREGADGFLDPSVFPLFNPRELAMYTTQGEVAYMAGKQAMAKAYIVSHPAGFLRLSGVRLVRFWSGTGTRDGSAWFAFHALLTTSLGMLGVWRLCRQRRFALATLFLLPLLLFPFPYYVTHAEFRYRLVVDPLLTILGAGGLAAFRERAQA